MGRMFVALLLATLASCVFAAEISAPDLPPLLQVNAALDEHLLVRNARSLLRLEQANQDKWNSGNYEFSLRTGSAQRQVVNTGQKLREWDVALERPLRLPNKVGIDQDIGAANVTRADFSVGDAHHEAGRALLHLWFVWLRERVQVTLWQQQNGLLAQQTGMVVARLKAGDAPKLELNLAQAAQAQAQLALQQAELREQLAANEVQRQFPAISLPDTVRLEIPQPILESDAAWLARIMDDNHELGMVEAQAQAQSLLAQRSRADRLPDPTVGLRYSNEMGGNEKVTGIFLTVPLSFGVRGANARMAEQQAEIAADQAAFVKHRLQNDSYAAYHQAVRSFSTYQQAREAAQAIRGNAELIAKAYRLGESSLSDSLSARRIAQDATLAEHLALLDANEARYRLLLDGHRLWSHDDEGGDHAVQ